MTLVPSSLRGRLVLAAVAVGLTFAVAFGAAAAWRVQLAEERAVHAALLSRVELARDEVNRNGSLIRDFASPKTDLVQVIGPDGRTRASSAALRGVAPLVDVIDVRGWPSGMESRVALQTPDIDLAVLAERVKLNAYGNSPAGTGALVVAVDAEGFNATTTDLLGTLLAGLVAVVLAMAALSWFLTGRALRSVTSLTERAEDVGPKQLLAGLPVPSRDAELGRMVRALNRMLVRLHESHATELAFAADAGHRLRTPVATLRAEAELALRETDPSETAAALERIVQDADQLSSIVDRMLARSRSRGHSPEPVFAALARAESRWRRQAELAAVTLAIHVEPRITPQTSSVGLVDIVEPIFDNAIRYTPAGGDIDIAVCLDRASQTRLVLDISNSGPPISADLVPHVFNAWVSSRDASVAGGLGLWLARETARDLAGDIELVHCGAHATTFRVSLPLVTAA